MIFLTHSKQGERHAKMHAVIGRAQGGLIRTCFASMLELVTRLYAVVIDYLGTNELQHFGPLDAAHGHGVTLKDLRVEDIYRLST